MSDMGDFPSSGRWIWNDIVNGLEFISAQQTSDKQVKKRIKKQKDALSCVHGRGVNIHPLSLQGRQGIRITNDHKNVTLQDVKDVAMYMLSEVEPIDPSFKRLFETKQLDDFLTLLLNYFHYFFDKLSREADPNSTYIEESLAEKKYLAEMRVKMETARKQLGRAYGVLILGIGMCTEHHMSCGTSRVSNMYRDRFMYETLYSFSTFVVWIAFRRREHEVVKKEVNRLLRSDTFNPVLRMKNLDDEDEEKESKMSPAEYRRTQGKRPPIKNIMNQRSAPLISLLPLPKEESSYLFTSEKITPEVLAERNEEDLTDSQMELEFKNLELDMRSVNVGIIGQPLEQFNLLTLSPLDEELDEKRNSLEQQLANQLSKSPSDGSQAVDEMIIEEEEGAADEDETEQ